MGCPDTFTRKSKIKIGTKSGTLIKVLTVKKCIQYFIELDMKQETAVKRIAVSNNTTLKLHYYIHTKDKAPSYPINADGSLKFKHDKLLIEVTKEQYTKASSLYLWFEPMGYATLYNPTDTEPFALGVCVVKLAKTKKREIEGKKIKSSKLRPFIGVAGYISDEMNLNTKSNVVNKINKLNKQANSLYKSDLQYAAAKAGLSQIELTFCATTVKDMLFNLFSSNSYKPFKYHEIVYRLIDKRSKDYDLIKKEFLTYPGSKMHRAIIVAFDQYIELKVEALNLWIGKVHTATSTVLSVSFPGSPTWDHKPYIGPIWAHKNRLGNVNYWIYYDVWSNMHYGYVGRQAGFQWDELELGSNTQQKADHGEADGDRDAQSMRAGFDMENPDIDKILTVIKKHKAKWGGTKASDRAK